MCSHAGLLLMGRRVSEPSTEAHSQLPWPSRVLYLCHSVYITYKTYIYIYIYIYPHTSILYICGQCAVLQRSRASDHFHHIWHHCWLLLVVQNRPHALHVHRVLFRFTCALLVLFLCFTLYFFLTLCFAFFDALLLLAFLAALLLLYSCFTPALLLYRPFFLIFTPALVMLYCFTALQMLFDAVLHLAWRPGGLPWCCVYTYTHTLRITLPLPCSLLSPTCVCVCVIVYSVCVCVCVSIVCCVCVCV